jgi:hypothetical protein
VKSVRRLGPLELINFRLSSDFVPVCVVVISTLEISPPSF